MSANSNVVRILELLSGDLNLTTDFGDALLEESKKQINSGKALWEISTAERLLNALNGPLRSTFLRDMRDYIIKYEKTISPAIILFGKPLSNTFDDASKDKADDAFRHLFKGILERKESIEVDWLSDVISSSEIAEQCEPESLESFKTRLIDLLKDDAVNEEIKEKAKRIATALGIDVEQIYSIKADEKEVKEVGEK